MKLNPDISAEQLYGWRIALELRLRQCNGETIRLDGAIRMTPR